MKFYKIKTKGLVNGVHQSGLDGVNVKDKEELFDRASGPDSFFEGSPVFDYLVPLNFHEEDEDKEPTMIFDYNYWWGESPRGGWLKPISKKFKDTLTGFNLGESRFYEAKVLFKAESYDYFIFQVKQNQYKEFIDFSKTSFNNLDPYEDFGEDELEIKQFSSLESVTEYAKENWDWIWSYHRVVMKPEFRELDFVTFYQLGDLVSERLKVAIESAGITGVAFQELPIPIEFSDEI